MVLGAYADFVLLPAHVVERNAFIKPPDLPFEEAALLEPLSCVVHAQELARPAKYRDCADCRRRTIRPAPHARAESGRRARGGRAGRGEERLRWAAELGADAVIDVRAEDAERQVAGSTAASGPTW